MDFVDAYRNLAMGHNVRRPSWPKYARLSLVGAAYFGFGGDGDAAVARFPDWWAEIDPAIRPWTPDADDRDASDWEVYYAPAEVGAGSCGPAG